MTSSCNSGIKRISQGLLFKNGCVVFSAFLLCFPLSLAGTITVINDPVRTALGDDVTLAISIDESVLVCVWYRGAVDVTNFILRVANGVQAEGSQYTRRESIVLPSHSLRIANATLADSGTYWVHITFTSAKDTLSNLTLKVLERISGVEVNISKNDVVEYNSSVDLSCSFTGTQETLQWIKDKETLEIKPGIELSNNNLSLHISNTSRDHTGNYSCKLCNAINCNISKSQHLNVYYGTDLPIITVYPKQPILVGSSVNITCTSASNPLPLYQWFLNDTLQPFMQTHAITNITKADEGTYKCVASNNQTGRMSSASIYITVTDSRFENGKLSAGAIAGISIGVVVSLALILTVGAVLLKKLRMPDENRSNASNARTNGNVNISNGLPIYENHLPDVHHQGNTGRSLESEASVYTDLQYKSDSTYSELERSKNKK